MGPLFGVGPLRSLRRGRDRQRLREGMWALVLLALLSAGVVGVLLLNTAMQQQAVTVTHQQQQVQRLSVRLQTLQTRLQRHDNPASLARRAQQLRMHPAGSIRWVRTVRTH